MKQREHDIFRVASTLINRLPKGLRDKVLLTGGSAAYLYGSDRPFSNDLDFLVPADRTAEIEKALGVSFTRHVGKPIFHTLKAVLEVDGFGCDLVAESVIDPTGHSNSYTISLTESILRKKVTVSAEGETLHLVPRELLVLIKLLAGRGDELRKYDIYDVERVFGAGRKFDAAYFSLLVKEFCSPVKKSLAVLIRSAEKVGKPKLLEVIKGVQPSA